jgi:hypothetical protein
MRYLRAFFPWIGYAVVAGFTDWRFGALTGLAVAAGLLIAALRNGNGLEALVLEISAAVFFAVLTVVAFAAPAATLRSYSSALSLGWLALTAWGSLVIDRPFTLGIARSEAPREVWSSPIFRRINTVLTTVWAASFTVTAAALAVVAAVAPHATVLTIVLNVLGIAVAAVFTARYPRIVAARHGVAPDRAA